MNQNILFYTYAFAVSFNLVDTSVKYYTETFAQMILSNDMNLATPPDSTTPMTTTMVRLVSNGIGNEIVKGNNLFDLYTIDLH